MKCFSVSDVSAVQALTGSNSDSVTGGQIQYHNGAILPKLYSQPNADVFSTIFRPYVEHQRNAQPFYSTMQ